jgi:hypothetical protein
MCDSLPALPIQLTLKGAFLNLRRAVLLSVLLLSLIIILTSPLAAQLATEQCSNLPPLITPNPDGSITLDLGDCFIFPGVGPGYDITTSTSIALPVLGPLHLSSLSYSPLTPDMNATWTVEICSQGCDGAGGGTLVTIIRRLWLADYSSCWNAGYYCWYSAKVTLR